ncbi:MAG: guanylate kinase, partial [Proteobacteria bacterium]|nr:guanylate kinase [Pseudomonadota bacterium]
MSHWAEYDYVLINRDVDESVDAVRAILAAERLRRERQVELPEFVKALREGQ